MHIDERKVQMWGLMALVFAGVVAICVQLYKIDIQETMNKLEPAAGVEVPTPPVYEEEEK